MKDNITEVQRGVCFLSDIPKSSASRLTKMLSCAKTEKYPKAC